MTYTIDRSGVGTDFTLETRVGSGTDSTDIFDASGDNVIASVNFNGHRFIREPYEDWPSSNGTSSDTLRASDDNDFIFWDLGTTDGLTSGGNPNNRVSDPDVRQRLPDADASNDRAIEVFDLRNGNDILNLTYRADSDDDEEEDSDDSNGYDGNVTVYGGGGNDVLALSDGDDLVYGGTGSDTIFGGGGLDRLFGDDGSTAIDESSGSADTIYAREGSNATLWGEGGNDYLYGSGQGVETFYGGAGDDTIYNASGYGDLSYGGSGNDRITIADTAYGGDGNDWIDGGFAGTGFEAQDSLYGDAGNDTLYGNDSNDKLYGGAGGDTLYGGTENDELHFSNDGDASGIRLWTGNGDAPFTIAVDSYTYSLDTFFGDDGIDTLVLDDGDNIFANSPGDMDTGSGFGVGGTNRMIGIEIVLAGAGADIIGLNHEDTGPGDDDSIYASNITIAGEDGDDIIVSGTGNDLLIGGRLGTGDGNGDDTIYGGGGNDIIYGDSRDSLGGSTGSGDDLLYGGAGQDTIYGGDGDDTIYGGDGHDYIYGGAGDDIIFDGGSANGFLSAGGSDVLVLELNNAGLNKAHSITGVDGPGDGDDAVYVAGTYSSVSFSLGGANDKFISGFNSDGSNAATGQVDRVQGESGDDIISTWDGNDILDGGADNDALWGGAGGDTVIGGAGTDWLYGGEGDNDQLFGGAGVDYYYWARVDGEGDQIYDEFRGNDLSGQAQNSLVVYSGYDASGALPAGTGVFEADGIITDNVGGDDMVHVYDLDGAGAGTVWRLEVLQGVGAGGYVEFDQRDIDMIELWNHDASPGTPVVTYYEWDGSTYSLV